ncbi:hypothetical protein MTO96_042116 [Rhipicephalus appendiculatus]
MTTAIKMDRRVSSGVDVLLREERDPGRPAVHRLSSCVKDERLLRTPKQTWTAVFSISSRDVCKVKTLGAPSSVSHRHDNACCLKRKSSGSNALVVKRAW